MSDRLYSGLGSFQPFHSIILFILFSIQPASFALELILGNPPDLGIQTNTSFKLLFNAIYKSVPNLCACTSRSHFCLYDSFAHIL
jgi:hypothetical protein